MPQLNRIARSFGILGCLPLLFGCDLKFSRVPVVASNSTTEKAVLQVSAGAMVVLQSSNTILQLSATGQTQPVTFNIQTAPVHGTATINSNQLVYVASADYAGSDSVTVFATEGTVQSDPVTIAITVVAGSVLALPGSITASEGISTPFTLQATQNTSRPLTYSIVSPASHGVAALSTANLGTYLPNAGFTGSDSFRFSVSDGSNSSTADVSITVTGTNHGGGGNLVANAQTVSLAENNTLGVLLTASGGQGALTFSISGNPAHGSVSLNGATATYTPTRNFHGSDSFQFQVTDASANRASANVTIGVADTVFPVLAQDHLSLSTNINQTKSLTVVATDANGDTLSFVNISTPAHGTVVSSGLTLTYTPASGYGGPDNFTYQVTDGTNDSEIGNVAIGVGTAVPTANSLSFSLGTNQPVDITLQGSSAIGAAVTYQIQSNPQHGMLSVLRGPVVTYTPTAGYNGTDAFIYRVWDGTVYADATVSLTIAAPASLTAYNATVVTSGNNALINFSSGGSPANLSVTYQVVTGPSHGLFGSNVYTATNGFVGTDSLTFRAQNANGTSNTATVTILVTANPVPVAYPEIGFKCPEGSSASIALHGAGAGNLTYHIVSGPSHGTLTLLSGVNYQYTPTAGYVGPDSFGFTVTDYYQAPSLPVTQVIQVVPPVAPPNFTEVGYPNQPISFFLISDAVNGRSFSVASHPQHGALSGTFPAVTYTPVANFLGSDSFTFNTSENGQTYGPTTVSIQIISPLSVTSTADSGAGTLRAVLLSIAGYQGMNVANQLPITFNIGGGGPQIITPLSPLPALAGGFFLDGSTQPGYSGAPLIGINLSASGASSEILLSDGSSLNALAVYGGSQRNIEVSGTLSTVQNSYIGLDLNARPSATLAASQSIWVYGFESQVEGNLIYGTAQTIDIGYLFGTYPVDNYVTVSANSFYGGGPIMFTGSLNTLNGNSLNGAPIYIGGAGLSNDSQGNH